jgi:hypothetical protein
VISSQLAMLVVFITISCCSVLIANAYAYTSNVDYSPIVISRDPSSPLVNILIHAPDFNSNSYGIDTIGEDGSTITISTRESSIKYRLAETGPDTGDFAGYIILSSSTSQCSPVCGPTDGYLAAGGDDAITVSFSYPDGQTISATSSGQAPIPIRPSSTVPEFPLAIFGLLVGMMSLVVISKARFIR